MQNVTSCKPNLTSSVIIKFKWQWYASACLCQDMTLRSSSPHTLADSSSGVQIAGCACVVVSALIHRQRQGFVDAPYTSSTKSRQCHHSTCTWLVKPTGPNTTIAPWPRMRIVVMPLWQQAIAFNDAGICGPERQFLGPSQSLQEMETHGLVPPTSSSRPPCGFIRNLLKTSSWRKKMWSLKPLSCKLRKVRSLESTQLLEMALSLYAGAMSTADCDQKRFGTESTYDRMNMGSVGFAWSTTVLRFQAPMTAQAPPVFSAASVPPGRAAGHEQVQKLLESFLRSARMQKCAPRRACSYHRPEFQLYHVLKPCWPKLHSRHRQNLCQSHNHIAAWLAETLRISCRLDRQNTVLAVVGMARRHKSGCSS